MLGSVKPLVVHCLQHGPAESPGNIEGWARSRGYDLRTTHTYRDDPYPDLDGVDLLVIMGGHMSVYDETGYPWLKQEKAFLKTAVSGETRVLGICLGAQLLAEVTGGRVYKGPFSEIGWFKVELSATGTEDPRFADFPPRFSAFQWHQDTFDLPAHAEVLAGSHVYPNQAFRIGEKVFAVQFHPEATEDILLQWVESTRGELPRETFVQRPDEILNQAERLEKMEKLFYDFLDRFIR